MRKLRFHESRLLRKTNFLKYEETATEQDHKLIAMYQIENRDQLVIYKRIVSMVKEISYSLAALTQMNEKTSNSAINIEKLDIPAHRRVIEGLTRSFTDKLYKHGLIRKNNLKDAANLKISDLCERRVTTLLKRHNFTNSIKEAVKLIKQGHILIGNKPIYSTDVLVTNGMENFIHWKDSSKHKKCIEQFNGCFDEYRG